MEKEGSLSHIGRLGFSLENQASLVNPSTYSGLVCNSVAFICEALSLILGTGIKNKAPSGITGILNVFWQDLFKIHRSPTF